MPESHVSLTYGPQQGGVSPYLLEPDARQFQVRSLGPSPRAYIIKQLLSDAECDELVQLAASKIKASTVVDEKTGEMVSHPGRTSSGTYFMLGEKPLIDRIEQRIAQLIGLPVENGEGLQVLHYEVGQFYKPHYDFFDPKLPGSAPHLAHGGQRVATVILYLNTPETAGETAFPNAAIKITPIKGNALVFFNCGPDGMPNPDTLHSSEPVIAGEKWIATKWVREREYI